MKIILIIFYIFFVLNGESQINKIDSICPDCRTLGMRSCGPEGLKELQIKKRLLKKDIRIMHRAEQYLQNSDTTFKDKFIKTKLTSRLIDSKNFCRIEVVKVNYFQITITTVFVNDSLFKGFDISKSTSAYCINQGATYYFDTRLTEIILKRLKTHYLYVCGSIIYVNNKADISYLENGKYDQKLRSPTKIMSNTIQSYSEFLANKN